jgi:hypothetical protein
MPPEDEHLSRAQPPRDGLESYRRLIELQKQMIQLSQQHEQSKRECAALREQVVREVRTRRNPGQTLRQRLQRSAGNWLKRVPGFGSGEMKLVGLNGKQVSSC